MRAMRYRRRKNVLIPMVVIPKEIAPKTTPTSTCLFPTSNSSLRRRSNLARNSLVLDTSLIRISAFSKNLLEKPCRNLFEIIALVKIDKSPGIPKIHD